MTDPLDQIASELRAQLAVTKWGNEQSAILYALNRARALPAEPQEPTEEMISAIADKYRYPAIPGFMHTAKRAFIDAIHEALSMRVLKRPAAEQPELRVAPSDEDASAAPAATATKYRKKPVIVAATQWFKIGDHTAVVEVPDRIRETWESRTTDLFSDKLGWIGTLEAGHVVTPGDFIITGVQGEMYPCKPDIFALTYEPAAAPGDTPRHRPTAEIDHETGES
jgi:hypothetical protein